MKHRQSKQSMAVLLSFSLLMAATILPAPHASAAKAKIKLNKKKLTLTVGDTYKLKLKNCKKKIKWSSSKKKVATVNAKGKIKAKKAGTTIITAKVKGKKYKCRVKVKKATARVTPKANSTTPKTPGNQATVTPNITQTPVPTSPVSGNTVAATVEPTPTDVINATPDPVSVTPNPLAENVSVTTEILEQHILLTVTNNNSVWMDTIDINYDYYNTNGENIASDFISLNYIPPEEIQYISIPYDNVNDDGTMEIDEELSEIFVDVTEPNLDGSYLDLHEKVSITANEMDTDNANMIVTVFNHSALTAEGSYAVFFYDADHNLVDVVSNTYSINPKTSSEEYVDLPYRIDDETGDQTILATDYEIVYFAHGFEETNEMSELTKNITLTPQKLTNTLLIEVKNNNSCWLSAVYVDYSFYDTEDNYLSSGSGSLLSMKAGETQAISIDIGESQLEDIDLEQSIVEITVEDNTEYYQYNTTNYVTTTTSVQDGSYNITIANNSSCDVEGSYIIYFYGSNRTLLDAYQETIYIMQGDEETIAVAAPVIYDTDGEPITIATYRVDTTVHTIQDID